MSSYTTSEIRGGRIAHRASRLQSSKQFVKPARGSIQRIKSDLKTGAPSSAPGVRVTHRSRRRQDTEMQYLPGPVISGTSWFRELRAVHGEKPLWHSSMAQGRIICIVTLWNNVPLVVSPGSH